MGTYAEQVNFAQVFKRPVLKEYQRSGGQQWGPRPPVAGGEDMMTGFYQQQESAVVAKQVMDLPTARTLTMYLKGFHDCTDWYLSDPGEDPNNYNYQRTRFVEWDGALYDFKNDGKTAGVGVAVPVTKTGSATWDRVAVTAPPERAITVVVWWSVLPLADENPDGPGPVGSGGSFGAYGQVMWCSVAGPDKGLFGTGPLSISLVGTPGINAIAWPAVAHAALTVPPSSTYEIALNFVAGIDTTYDNGVGRGSQVARTRLVGNFESFGAELSGVTTGVPLSYFQGFSSVPDVGPAKFENDSFSMMTVTTY